MAFIINRYIAFPHPLQSIQRPLAGPTSINCSAPTANTVPTNLAIVLQATARRTHHTSTHTSSLMEDTISSKRRANEDPPMLTPPTPRVNSFSHGSSSGEDAAILHAKQRDSSATTTRVTPPSTASPLKYPRDSTSPVSQYLNHDGITSFGTADPPLTDLLVGPPSSPYHPRQRRPSSTPSPRSTSRNPASAGYQNNTIINTIRELGYVKYLQLVNPPRFLPAQLRATPVTPEPAAPVLRTPPKKKSAQTQSRNTTKSSRANNQVPSKKRKLSVIEPNSAFKTPPAKVRKSEDRGVGKTPDSQSKKAKTIPPVAPPKSSPAKPKSRKTPKKAGNIGTSKPEKSRTKEQRWGDYLKNIVGGEKDAYQQLPERAIPPPGHLIDQVPVRPYTFNKGKVQDYGNSQGLHTREMELAREVGLSYDAYRQQKRMAFIGYAAMQLEGKKEFKKSHTQSMCNIDGNKATHLWVHFHDCWGWMPENPTPPITILSLAHLQLPDLHVAQPQQ